MIEVGQDMDGINDDNNPQHHWQSRIRNKE